MTGETAKSERMTQQVLVNIDVDDLAKAIAFYQGAFDLTIGRRLGAFGVELIGAGLEPCPTAQAQAHEWLKIGTPTADRGFFSCRHVGFA